MLFIAVFVVMYFNDANLQPNKLMLFIPFLVLLMGIMGLGLGIIVSSFTTKYRDLRFLISFGIQLFMYITPVILPLSQFKGLMKKVVMANPMTPIIETFKAAFLGVPKDYAINGLFYTTIFTVVIFCLAILIFNKVEKSFMDTV